MCNHSSYGPPVTLGWEYEEYVPLAVEAYEAARPPRRDLREMGLNYYQRRDLLSAAGFEEADLRGAERELGKEQRRRELTRAVASRYLLFKSADAVESAGRKFKRLLRDDHWKSQKSVHSTA